MLLGVLGWLALAIALGASGAFRGLRAPALLALGASLAFVLLVASWVVPGLRRFAETADLRLLASFHLLRFAGLDLLVLGHRGLLPSWLVLAAGVGNVLVALAALVLLTWVAPGTRRGRPWWIGWNLLGLLVGLCVGGTILVVGRTDPDAMRAFQILPLSLLPSFVAPMALATHAWMLVRLSRRR